MTRVPATSGLEAGRKALNAGAFDRAAELFESVLEGDPANIGALQGASQAYRHFNRNDRIVELYSAAAEAEPAESEVQAGYVESLIANSQIDRAREVASAAIASHPGAVRLRLLHAQTDMVIGDRESARATFWECLKLDPDNVDCAYHLAQIAPADELPQVERVLDRLWAQRESRETWDAATLGFAYGRAAERAKDYEKAWEGYAFGAGKRRSLVQFDERTYARTHDAHARTFTAATPIADEASAPGAGYVFIASLPRTGSTLVEQILDAHPDVEAIGERSIVYDAVTFWHRTFGDDPQKCFNAEALRAARQYYIERARALVRRPDSIIVDKSITNYVFLGFLRAILPGARFVHVTRDPLDTAISCFTMPFFAGNEWTYDLAEIGRNIRRYQKLMRNWMRQWPGDIHTVSYESLIEAPEATVRELLAFCRLEWDPACLDFHKDDRPVLTASLNQVRQPIYKTAKGRAEPYKAHLGPLISAMGRRAADPEWYRAAGDR